MVSDSSCGFAIRKLMQLKNHLYFLLDGVPNCKGTKTPVSVPGECRTTLPDHSPLGSHSLHVELEPADLQEPHAVLGFSIPWSKGVCFVHVHDLNQADSSLNLS